MATRPAEPDVDVTEQDDALDLEAQFEVDDAPTRDDVDTTPQLDVEEPGPEATTDNGIEIGGRRYSNADLEPYVEFAEWARSDPARWQALQELESGEALIVPAAQFPNTDVDPNEFDADEYDYADPDDEVARLRAEVSQHAAYIQRREESETMWAIEDATSQFQSAHPNLTADEFERVTQTAVDLRLVESIRDRDPGMPRNEIARRAFEHAYRIEFFDKHAAEGGRQVVQDMRRRRRAAASGGSPTSVSRTDPMPTTKEEVDAAITREIAEAMGNQ